MKTLAVVVAVVLVLGGAYYGWWRYQTRAAKALARVAAFVELSEKDADCKVSTLGSMEKRSVPCGEVGRYLRDELKLPAGVPVAVWKMGKVDPARAVALRQELTRLGYPSGGLISVGFITEPGK